jgi:hypothetical protein
VGSAGEPAFIGCDAGRLDELCIDLDLVLEVRIELLGGMTNGSAPRV